MSDTNKKIVLVSNPQKNLPQIINMLREIKTMLKKTHVLSTNPLDATCVFGPPFFQIAAQVLSHALHEFQRREEVCNWEWAAVMRLEKTKFDTITEAESKVAHDAWKSMVGSWETSFLSWVSNSFFQVQTFSFREGITSTKTETDLLEERNGNEWQLW